MADPAAVASALEQKRALTAQLEAQLAAAKAEEAELAAADARLAIAGVKCPELEAVEASGSAALQAARARLAALTASEEQRAAQEAAARAEEATLGSASAAAAQAAEAAEQAAAAAAQAVARLEAKARLLPLYKSCSAAAARASPPAHFDPAFQGFFSVSVRLQEDMGIAFAGRCGFTTVHRVESVAPGGPMAAVGVRAGDVLFSWEHCFLGRGGPESSASGPRPRGALGQPPFFDLQPSSGEVVAMAFERGVWQ